MASVLSALSISWEIYCHQMSFKFWNYNRFETGVIDFVGHGLPATFILFPETTNWHHEILWQLNNQLHTTHKSYLMLSQRLYFLVHANRLNKSIYTYILTLYHGTRQNRLFFFSFFRLYAWTSDECWRNKKIVMFRLDVMNDVYVNTKAVLERFTSYLLTWFHVGIFLIHSSV